MDRGAGDDALKRLQASEERLKRALRVAKVGSWEWDVVNDSLEWTDELYGFFGVEPATFEASYNGYLTLVHPDDRAMVDAVVQAAFATGEPFELVHRVLRPDGDICVMQCRGEVVQDDTGNTIAMTGTGQDVTEAHKREEALAETERQLLVAQRLGRSGTWRYDIKTGRSEWSPELFRLYGFEPGSEPVELDSFLAFMEPEDAAVVRAKTEHAVATGEGWSGDVHIRTVTGERRILFGTAEVETDRSGKPVCIRGTRQDVTELRQHEQQLRESEERALLASAQKSQFLANMSHEIRTPLNGVVGMTELLADSALTPMQREHVNALRGAATSLLGLLNDILDLSKIEAGKITVESVDTNLPSLIEETVALFKVAAHTKGIELRAVVDPSTPQWVRTDAARVKQVFGNLIGNALKFTERGGVTFDARCVADRLVFRITDTGIGIADSDAERLMSPFEQGDVSTTRKFGGTGLGLTICRELTGLMGGSLGFTSELGRGTTFQVELPYVAGAPTRSVAVAVSIQPDEPSSGGRVLLAEDTPVNQMVARAMLEKSGWVVEIVENGQDAVDALEAESYDVIILDCQMPVLDGYEAAKRIRKMASPVCDLPILAMTASALPEDRQRCLDAGMDEYLTKPISRGSLDAALERVVSRNAS